MNVKYMMYLFGILVVGVLLFLLVVLEVYVD